MPTIVRKEKRQRSTFGKLIKFIFIAFNVSMIIWLVSAMGAISQMPIESDAARVGQALGATIGFSMILSIWMMGDVPLGIFVLLTRGDTVIVEETMTGGFASRSIGEPSAGDVDPDAMIVRYKEQQQSMAHGSEPSSPPSKAGFGHRH